MSLKIYLDTNAIIRFIESSETDIVRLFEDSASGLIELYTSELTLAEALVGPYKIGDDRLTAEYEAFLQLDDFMTIVPVDRDVLRMSARLRADLGGKAPDAVHVATACLEGCEIIVSSDRRLRLPGSMRRVAIEDIAEWDDGR